MRLSPSSILIVSTLLTTGCGPKATAPEDYYSAPLTLPDGAVIQVEHMRSPQEMMRGMMFRQELKPDRGMLFSHGAPGHYPYWMFQVRMPLDIVWLDATRRIVEISPNTPACPDGPASKCPHYGGNAEALFVVELAGGVAARHGLKLGDTLTF
jgi:uncharacterized membrane protein (UPF0127 family)